MSKLKAGGVVPGSPTGGTTFGSRPSTLAPTLRGSSTSPGRKIHAGALHPNSPQGTTWQGNKSHINMPNAKGVAKELSVSHGPAKHFVPDGKGRTSGVSSGATMMNKRYGK